MFNFSSTYSTQTVLNYLNAILVVVVILLDLYIYAFRPYLIIKNGLKQTFIEEGKHAELDITISADRPPTCKWYKNGKPLILDERIIQIFNVSKECTELYRCTLHIRCVTLADEGIYSVTCQNGKYTLSSRTNLYIVNKNIRDSALCYRMLMKNDSFTRKLRNVNVKNGDQIQLCVKLNTVVTDVKWYKFEQQLKGNSRIIVLNEDNHLSLTVQRSQLDDTGVYYVVVNTQGNTVSSFANVYVAPVNEPSGDMKNPIFIKELPALLCLVESDTLRLVCKAAFNSDSNIIWEHNGGPINRSKFTPQLYDDKHVGLKGVSLSSSDAGSYTVTIQDKRSKVAIQSECIVMVYERSLEANQIPVDMLGKPLNSVIATVGSKVMFECMFNIENASDVYAVWYCGAHRISKSYGDFKLESQCGTFILLLEKLEPDMVGEVTCELRKKNSFRTSFCLCSTKAYLSIVPNCALKDVKIPAKKLDLYDKLNPCVMESNYNVMWTDYRTLVRSKQMPTMCCIKVSYSAFNNGVYIFHGSRINRKLNASVEHHSDPRTFTLRFDPAIFPPKSSFYVYMKENDGSYTKVDVCRNPEFEIRYAHIGSLLNIWILMFPSYLIDEEYSIRVAQPSQPRPKKIYCIRNIVQYKNDYKEISKKLGKGSYGNVVLVEGRNGEPYACKIIKAENKSIYNMARREIKIMMSLEHPNLVQFVEGFYDTNTFYFVMEYLRGGDLSLKIIERNMIEEDVVVYIRQLCEALVYLHSRKIAHLDLKPKNIVFRNLNSRHLKVIDFGLSRVLKVEQTLFVNYGTKGFMSPEITKLQPVSVAADMWSLGVVTRLLLSNMRPSEGDSKANKHHNISRAQYDFEDVSRECNQFVDRLLVKNPVNRMTAAEALQHNWLKFGKKDPTK